MEKTMYISDNAEVAENKLIILYISRTLGMPLSNKRYSQIVTEGNLFNFFLLQHLIEDLTENGYLIKSEEINGETAYNISQKGIETLDFLIYKIPGGIRSHIDRIASSKSETVRQDRNIVSYIDIADDGSFLSVLEIRDKKRILLSLKYASPTRKDAMEIAGSLKDKAEEIYGMITGSILE
jgi:predicted transcriptional regulator